MSISWKQGTAEDSQTLAEWNFQLIRDEGHRNPMTVAELAERMRGWIGREYRSIIFYLSDLPVGYALYRQDPEMIYLRQFFIRSDRRRRGLGRECFRILREEIWPKDVRLTVDVLCRNTSGTAFWRAVGYTDYCLTLEILPNVKTV